MRHPLLALGLIAILTASLHAQDLAEPPLTSPPPAITGCHIDHTQPSPGDQQLAREDYKAAETTFRETLTAHPNNLEARLGLVRALIGQDRTAEAEDEAVAMLRASPNAALSDVAISDAAVRSAKLNAASTYAQKAYHDDICSAQAAAAMANVYTLLGYYAHAARQIAQAHLLRPNDELIRRAWINSLPNSLPRRERQAELASYLQGPHHLSPEREQGYTSALTYLQASRPGECRISSKADSTSIPLRPVYADHPQPVAFGLDITLNKTPRRMQIDTGASGIVLTPSAAKSLNLAPEYHLKDGGVGDDGKVDSFLSHVASITIGDLEISDCMVQVLGKSRLSVDGLIGTDVFSRYLITLDYPKARLRLDPLPKRPPPDSPSADPAGSKPTLHDTVAEAGPQLPQDGYVPPGFGNWIHIIRIGHQLLLPAFFQSGGTQHYLVMDTGASRTILSPTMAREAGELHSSNMRFVGLSGEVKDVYETGPTPLFFANLRLPPEPYIAYDLTAISHNNGFETSGLFGLPTLQRLTIQIDYRDNLLKLTYDRKHDTIRF